MIDGFRCHSYIIYVDVIDENASQNSTIYKCIDKIEELYGSGRWDEGGITVLGGDQQTFTVLLWRYHDMVEMTNQDGTSSLFVPLPGGFHNEKTCIVETIKQLMEGTGFEALLEDSGFFQS